MAMKHEASVAYDKGYPYHFPYALRRDHEYEEGLKQCVAAVNDGMTAMDAISMVFEVSPLSINQWFKWFEEDIDKGFTRKESRLINLFLTLGSKELNMRRKLERRANKLALDEENTNTEMLKFLLERRHGYTKQTQKEVDVSVADDAPLTFEFVDMTPTENEE